MRRRRRGDGWPRRVLDMLRHRWHEHRIGTLTRRRWRRRAEQDRALRLSQRRFLFFRLSGPPFQPVYRLQSLFVRSPVFVRLANKVGHLVGLLYHHQTPIFISHEPPSFSDSPHPTPDSPLTTSFNLCTSSPSAVFPLKSSSSSTISSTSLLYLDSISRKDECAFRCSLSRSSLPCSRATTARLALSLSEVRLSIESCGSGRVRIASP